MSEASGSNNARTELAEIVKCKSKLTETIANLERQIYGFETSLLQSNNSYGNIITDLNRYHRSADQLSGNAENVQRNRIIREIDRIFSNSSATSMAIVSGQLEHGEIAKLCSEKESNAKDEITKKSGNSNGLKNGQTTHRNSSERACTTKKLKKQ